MRDPPKNFSFSLAYRPPSPIQVLLGRLLFLFILTGASFVLSQPELQQGQWAHHRAARKIIEIERRVSPLSTGIATAQIRPHFHYWAVDVSFCSRRDTSVACVVR